MATQQERTSTTVVRLSNFNYEDHESYEATGVGLEDIVKKPVPVDFKTTLLLRCVR